MVVTRRGAKKQTSSTDNKEVAGDVVPPPPPPPQEAANPAATTATGPSFMSNVFKRRGRMKNDPRALTPTRALLGLIFLTISSLYIKNYKVVHEQIDALSTQWNQLWGEQPNVEVNRATENVPKSAKEEVKPMSSVGVPKRNAAPQSNHVTMLINGYHFEDIARDTPWTFRTPSLLLFRDESCKREAEKLEFPTRWNYPSRQHVFLGIYNMDTKNDLWFQWEEDMDLAKRFGITTCPQLVMVSRDYVLENRTAEIDIWDGSGKWDTWAEKTLLRMGEGVVQDKVWSVNRLKARDRVETSTHEARKNIPPRLPHFTEHGWMKRKMPDGLLERLVAFYKKHEHQRSIEEWGKAGTQTNYHEHPMTLVYLDLDPYERDRIAKEFVRPVVEEWSGLNQLKLNAFYGIREYYRGSELRTHLDRTETHVLSAILQIDQINVEEPWYLEVYDFNGTILQLDMEPGDMILYESASLAHGRPRPMKGDKYINAFVHFSPANWNFKLAGNTVSKVEGTEDFVPLRDPLPVLRKSECPEESHEFMSKSSTVPGEIIFRNAAGEALSVYWMDFKGIEQHVAFLDVAEDVPVNTFLNHAFRVRFQSDQTLAQEIVVETAETSLGIGTCPPEKRGKKAAKPVYARDEL